MSKLIDKGIPPESEERTVIDIEIDAISKVLDVSLDICLGR